MAATLTQERFTGPEWIFERKYDGIRALAFKSGGDVRLFSRNRLPQHNPAVSAAIAALDADDVILDGELTWRGEETIAYYVFDVLWLDGRDVRLHSTNALHVRCGFAASASALTTRIRGTVHAARLGGVIAAS
jgi:ATP-dependent DNA ligase